VRIEQYRAVGRDNRREVAQRKAVMLHPCGRLVIGATIDEPKRIAIPDGEALQAQRVGVVGRTDEHDSALTMVQKAHPAQNKGPHEDLAEIRLRRHHVAHIPVQNPDDPSVALGCRGDEYGTRADVIQFTGELPGPMHGQGFLAAISAHPGHRDLTLDDEKEIGAAIAAGNKVWPGRILSAPTRRPARSTPLEAGKLGRCGRESSAESVCSPTARCQIGPSGSPT
jgi:hypothetical protein